MSTPTPEELQQQIAANTETNEKLTSALDMLMHKFIEPNAKQTFSNFERLEDIVEITVTQIGQNTDAVKSLIELLSSYSDNLERVRKLLEETRAVVAQNASQTAQMNAKLERATTLSEAHENQMAELRENDRRSRAEIAALKELVLSQWMHGGDRK